MGVIGDRAGPALANADKLKITIHGRQSQGAVPWHGAAPIVTSAQVVPGLQIVVNCDADPTREPAVVTTGAIKGGVYETNGADAGSPSRAMAAAADSPSLPGIVIY